MSRTLYDPQFEHDACGVGFVAHAKGEASHRIVELGLEVLRNMEHRGAFGSDPTTGDGAGILTQLPDRLFRAQRELPDLGSYGVGMVFLPRRKGESDLIRDTIESQVRLEGQTFLGWRQVPIDPAVLGRLARASEPDIWQFFVGKGRATEQASFERKLFVIRKSIEGALAGFDGARLIEGFAICSLSSRTIVYKGLLTPVQVQGFYRDLQQEEYVSTLALVHQRFSTNTLPSWPLAHPYRLLAHNGEINTIRGNRRWMRAREMALASEVYGDDIKKLFPLVSPTGSDSASLDNAVELLMHGGMSVPQALMILIPEAFEKHKEMDEDRKGFYRYYKSLIEPWDGPASICFTDGKVIGGILDRNGLRPARFAETRDDLVVYGSEAGVLRLDPDQIVRLGRLKPGEVFLVDPDRGGIVPDADLKREIVERHPFARLSAQRIRLSEKAQEFSGKPPVARAPLQRRRRIFGYTREDLELMLRPMAQTGEEPIGSMGADVPQAVLSDRPQPLFNYFRQSFAQVTNPAIDPIRESLVMSLSDSIGANGSILTIEEGGGGQIEISSPVLTLAELEALKSIEPDSVVTVDATYDSKETHAALERAVERLCRQASLAVEARKRIILVSDEMIGPDRIPVPILLAVSAMHQHLTREGTRDSISLIPVSGAPREPHHFACLLGYGATAICPTLALETCAELAQDQPDQAQANFVKAINKGLLKIMSKMGISTSGSYRGSQLFEAVGISSSVTERWFTDTPSRIGGLDLEDIEKEYRSLHALAWTNQDGEDPGGVYQWRRFGERHAVDPKSVVLLQQSVRGGSFETFQEFSDYVDASSDHARDVRGMLEITPTRPAVPLDEVEPDTEIVKRFCTGAMSLGSISKDSHEGLARAMNSFGGRSNSGEGGEDPARYGQETASAIKQVASGRFGVTTEYLVNARELQIKVAQGAKPGEGGQLPGYKVNDYIGRIRHTTPGVTLISPPPHHDIYSIEDLAQLIYDLKSVNPSAAVSVKLVAGAGVGTIAAGVVKADADHILISGADGGTGASPLTSIRHAGLPWELGLAETQQTLLLNGLRGRVRLQADGQMRTGRDVVIAALLGADEVGFSTIPLVAQGCIMMRVCHLGTCPVGIATQDPELAKKFQGKPEHVINYFFFVARQVREIMARLGFRRFEEMVGHSECLRPSRKNLFWKTRRLDFSPLLTQVEPQRHDTLCFSGKSRQGSERPEASLVTPMLDALRLGYVENRALAITNVDRSFGAYLSGELVRRAPVRDRDVLRIDLKGTAGQSFGAFLASGIELKLQGDANDYVGKGLSGGRIIICPSSSRLIPRETVLAGNTLLYGATSGELFLAGSAGERFAVRNSGATAVVEGVGDHACEYMTGGRILILGDYGRNFGAGMSGGQAWVYDPDDRMPYRIAEDESLLVLPLDDDEDEVRELLSQHVDLTGSSSAREILKSWSSSRKVFRRVVSREYNLILQAEKTREAAHA
jgi:glutamate synthase domain-containing protein 2/glutamate synthase domain-containing protein 1/glutamate synthase domain-containing protein 3